MSSYNLPYTESPLLHSLYLSELAGAQVFLKLENTQPSGSFKSRGLGNLVYQTVCGNNPSAPLPLSLSGSVPPNYFHFFSPSGGNAGCATAYAARQYNQLCTVCLPTVANPIMIERIRKTGANVVVFGDSIAESVAHIQNVLIPACTNTAVYCHPYDNELVWQGNSSIMDEIFHQLSSTNKLINHIEPISVLPKPESASSEKSTVSLESLPFPSSSPLLVTSTGIYPPSPSSSTVSLSNAASNAYQSAAETNETASPAAIMCSVGGGGLYNGIVQGLVRHGWSSTNVIAVETEGCATLHHSINSVKQGGSRVEIPTPSTIATSLATINVTNESVVYAIGTGSHSSLHDGLSSSKTLPETHSVVITDEQAAQACINFVKDHNMLIEAACGTALAPIYNGTIKQVLPNLKPDDKIVVVLCGGTSISFKILKEYAEKFKLDF